MHHIKLTSATTVHSGFFSHDIAAIAKALSASKAAGTVKLLQLGPPVDTSASQADPSQDTPTPDGLRAACKELQVLRLWGMMSQQPPEDSWQWTSLEGGGFQGTNLAE